MSAETNGTRMFIYVVTHLHEERDGDDGMSTYIVRSDHDPSDTELVKFLGLDYDARQDSLEAERFSEEEIVTIPPKT